jgi:hypothetical protein
MGISQCHVWLLNWRAAVACEFYPICRDVEWVKRLYATSQASFVREKHEAQPLNPTEAKKFFQKKSSTSSGKKHEPRILQSVPCPQEHHVAKNEFDGEEGAKDVLDNDESNVGLAAKGLMSFGHILWHSLASLTRQNWRAFGQTVCAEPEFPHAH